MNNIEMTIKGIIQRQSVIIKDESIFDSSYTPTELLHRGEEIKFLANHFKTILRNNLNHGRVLIIQGAVGTGKTSVARAFGNEFAQLTKNSNLKHITFIYINARQVSSWYMLLSSILRNIMPNFPLRGYSTNELLLFLLKTLENKKINLLLCLDEIDYLLDKGNDQSILYSLLRINENTINRSHISLILVTKNFDFIHNLDKSICSSLSQEVLRFNRYKEDEIFSILKKRATQALFNNTFDDEILALISKNIAIKGDARLAIELLWRAAKVAEKSNSLLISKGDINEAQINVLPIDKAIILDINIQLKIILFTLAKTLSGSPIGSKITSSKLKIAYETVCEDLNLISRSKTQFWEYLNQLNDLGLINMTVKNQHSPNGKSLGRKTLIWMEGFPLQTVIKILENNLQEKINGE